MHFSLNRSAANRFVLAAAAVLFAAGPLNAQEETAEPPTLPEVEVRPDEEEAPPAEDGAGDQNLVGITPEGSLYTFARNAMANDSELAGSTFSPDGSTLFVNIQEAGLTLAITGPWSRA